MSELPADPLLIVLVFGLSAGIGAGSKDGRANIEVAVKMLPHDRRVSADEKQDLWEEIKFLRHISMVLGGHPHVIQMYGYTTDTGSSPMMLVLEFAERGSLLGYLRQTKTANRELQTLLPSQSIRFATEIAGAMAFIAENKLVHRDLAARNVLLDHELKCKVTDFGLARDVYESDGAYQVRPQFLQLVM